MKTENRNRKISLAVLFLAMLVLTPAVKAAMVTTDQEDYAPWELVTINGSGFEPLAPITLTIEWPDKYVDEFYGEFDADWNFIWTSTTCDPELYGGSADDQGNFYLMFGKELMEGTFTVVATDGTNTATKTFTDAVTITGVYSSNVSGTAKNSFFTTDDVYASVITSGGSGANNIRLYVVNAIPASGASLTDVSGGYESVSPNTEPSTFTYMVWHFPTIGTYYIIVDGGNGQYGGSDRISSSFTVSAPPDTTDPEVAITNPADGATVESQDTIEGTIDEDDCLDSAEVRIQRTSDNQYWNGATWQVGEVWVAATIGGSAPNFTFSYDSSAITEEDTYTVTARATDCSDNTGTSTSVSYTIEAPVEMAEITFYSIGVSNDFLGSVITIDGVVSFGALASAAGVTVTKNVGESISFEYHSPLGVDAGKRYVWTSTTGLSTVRSGSVTVESGGGSVTGMYKTQYHLTLDSNPALIGNQTGGGWYDDGDTANISTDENVDIISGQSRYHFTDWSTDNMDEIGDEFAASTTVLVDQAKTVTANYVTQYLVTFAQTGLDGTATGTVVTVDGETKEYGDLSFAKWVDSGDTVDYKYEILVNSSVPGFQFWLSSVTGSASPITVTSAVTVTGNYTHLPLSAITAGGCPFDRDPGLEGQQFRLIFTQDPTNISTYKLTASNPGQFFYNVFYVGTPGQTANLILDIPFPFVTQGAMPVHVYKSVSIVDGCFVPADEILVLPALGGNSPNHTINVTVPDTGLVYVRIHLDYGLKKEVGYTKDTSNNAEKPVGTDAIIDLTSYVFGVSGDTSDTQTIQNMNVFKRNPGFGGLVTGSVTGDTLANVEVKIYTSAKKLLATVNTDEDGFYYYYYKHTGKSATYYIEVNGVTQTVIVKANGLAIADFQI